MPSIHQDLVSRLTWEHYNSFCSELKKVTVKQCSMGLGILTAEPFHPNEIISEQQDKRISRGMAEDREKHFFLSMDPKNICFF